MANAKFIVGQTGGQIDFSVVPSTPSNPSAGYVTAYSDGSTFQVIDSSGNPLIIGQTGAQGPAGATGAQGPAGATGAGASSPITVEQTNSLVSTAIGATAIAGGSIAIGLNAVSNGACQVVIGNGARTCNVNRGVIIGSNVFGCGLDDQYASPVVIGTCSSLNSIYAGVAIGSTVSGFGEFPTVIGTNSTACTGAVAIGLQSRACSESAITIGRNVTSSACRSTTIGYVSCSTADFAITIGADSCSTSACSKTIGIASTIFPGATGAIVLGNSSVGGTGACNSVVLGNSSQTTGACSITIGNSACAIGSQGISIGSSARTECKSGFQNNSIAIGANTCALGSDGSSSIAIGLRACTTQGVGSIAIGTDVCDLGQGGATIVGRDQCSCSYNNTMIGMANISQGNNAVTLGNTNKSNVGGISIGTFSNFCITTPGQCSIALGWFNCSCGDHSIALGTCSLTNGASAITIWNLSCSTVACSISIGNSACASHACAVALGAGITTTRANTTHVNSLVAYGQAASLANAVGSTGGTATLNWDNSNVQFVTLTSSVTSLTKSNPIDGAVYTVFVTQGGSGGYTVNWGTDVRWAGGTGPTLSTAIGATDAVSLVYYAGITGYYGNANLNFA